MVQKNKLLFFFLTFNLLIINGFSQNIEIIKDSILKEIYHLQCKNDEFYNDGLFPSKRNRKEDNNIFFSALITYTLQNIRENFSLEQQILIDTMMMRVKQNYPHYQSRKGDITYNFWQIRPKEIPMPNSLWFHKWRGVLLADDLDDTSIIFLTLNNPKNDSLLKQKMTLFTNQSTDKLRAISKKYQHYEAYFTWFGSRKTNDFDICILANALLFVFEKNLPINHYDMESLKLIHEMIISNDHFNNPYSLSNSYKKTAIYLYNVSRMLEKAPNDLKLVNELKEKVIIDLKNELDVCKTEMEKILILSSLARLGIKMPFYHCTSFKEFEKFAFFDANYMAKYHVFFKKIVGQKNLLAYKCLAYSNTLYLEYLYLYEKSCLIKQ